MELLIDCANRDCRSLRIEPWGTLHWLQLQQEPFALCSSFNSSKFYAQGTWSSCYLWCSLESKGKAQGSVSRSRALKPRSLSPDSWSAGGSDLRQVSLCFTSPMATEWDLCSTRPAMFLRLHQPACQRHPSTFFFISTLKDESASHYARFRSREDVFPTGIKGLSMLICGGKGV